MARFPFITAVTLAISVGAAWGQQQITMDSQAAAKPFPHFWEQAFGSGRAILALRDSYRQDLDAVKQATGFEYVRFHGIFDDEVGVYTEDAHGNPVYNFSYVDEIRSTHRNSEKSIQYHGVANWLLITALGMNSTAAT